MDRFLPGKEAKVFTTVALKKLEGRINLTYLTDGGMTAKGAASTVACQ